ncbi:MAG: acetyl-CoA carboxylase biotin carboxyl carrier protein [bacterium]
MNIEEIKQLVELMEQKNLSEIEYSKADERIKIVRNAHEIVATSTESLQTQKLSENTQAETKGNNKLISVNSPFVGTFYCAPSPSEKPFVEIGSKVKKGQTIGIVEAMKLMNAIEADADGYIKQILKKDGDPVEFGEPLFIIDPEG